jgi:hypothetical protein
MSKVARRAPSSVGCLERKSASYISRAMELSHRARRDKLSGEKAINIFIHVYNIYISMNLNPCSAGESIIGNTSHSYPPHSSTLIMIIWSLSVDLNKPMGTGL